MCVCICTVSVNSSGLYNDCVVIDLRIHMAVEGISLPDALNLQ